MPAAWSPRTSPRTNCAGSLPVPAASHRAKPTGSRRSSSSRISSRRRTIVCRAEGSRRRASAAWCAATPGRARRWAARSPAAGRGPPSRHRAQPVAARRGTAPGPAAPGRTSPTRPGRPASGHRRCGARCSHTASPAASARPVTRAATTPPASDDEARRPAAGRRPCRAAAFHAASHRRRAAALRCLPGHPGRQGRRRPRRPPSTATRPEPLSATPPASATTATAGDAEPEEQPGRGDRAWARGTSEERARGRTADGASRRVTARRYPPDDRRSGCTRHPARRRRMATRPGDSQGAPRRGPAAAPTVGAGQRRAAVQRQARGAHGRRATGRPRTQEDASSERSRRRPAPLRAPRRGGRTPGRASAAGLAREWRPPGRARRAARTGRAGPRTASRTGPALRPPPWSGAGNVPRGYAGASAPGRATAAAHGGQPATGSRPTADPPTAVGAGDRTGDGGRRADRILAGCASASPAWSPVRSSAAAPAPASSRSPTARRHHGDRPAAVRAERRHQGPAERHHGDRRGGEGRAERGDHLRDQRRRARAAARASS